MNETEQQTILKVVKECSHSINEFLDKLDVLLNKNGFNSTLTYRRPRN